MNISQIRLLHMMQEQSTKLLLDRYMTPAHFGLTSVHRALTRVGDDLCMNYGMKALYINNSVVLTPSTSRAKNAPCAVITLDQDYMMYDSSLLFVYGWGAVMMFDNEADYARLANYSAEPTGWEK